MCRSIRQRKLLNALFPLPAPKSARALTVFQARDKRQTAILKLRQGEPTPPPRGLWAHLKALWLAQALRFCGPAAPAPTPYPTSLWVPKSFGERCPVCHDNPNMACANCAGNGLED